MNRGNWPACLRVHPERIEQARGRGWVGGGDISAGQLVRRDQPERLVGFGFCSGGDCWADS